MADVYCYGMISPSTVYLLTKDFLYPQANTYAEVECVFPSVGGEAANSAIVLQKLGIPTSLDGTWIARERSGQLFELLGTYGLDLSLLSVKDSGGTSEIVIADGDTRTVFGNYTAFHSGPRQWNVPDENAISQARVVALDPYFKYESKQAAELCVKHKTPYVTLDSPYNDFIAQNAAIVVISHELVDKEYQGVSLKEVFDQYLEYCRGLVIFSFGEKDLQYGRKGGGLNHFSPYKITPVDTTAAGDSFRGSLCYGLLEGWNDEQTIRFASAVAALVCLTMPHALKSPTLNEVMSFISDNTNQNSR